jgi:hypothetical protein
MAWYFFQDQLLHGKNSGLNDHIRYLYRCQIIQKLVESFEPEGYKAKKKFECLHKDPHFHHNLMNNFDEF